MSGDCSRDVDLSISSLRFFALSVLLLGFSFAGAQQVHPRPLITTPINENQVVTLRGNVHPLAQPMFDVGVAPPDLPVNRMLLVLKRSPEQETALRTLLDEQQDKASANFHKWLTPEQFGAEFGPSDDDMQKITAWLQSHGFQVGTTKGRTVLEFSGTEAQVEEAFHTSIHQYLVNGKQHWANSTDPQIPAALAPAVVGIATLHNFVKRPLVQMMHNPIAAGVGSRKAPQINFGGGTHALAPSDYATIYNFTSLYDYSVNAGVSASIGVVGRSNLFNGGQDVQNFRDIFIPCCAVGNFQIILNGPDPGDAGGADEAEATLDTSWPGAVATGAYVKLVVSGSTNTTDGVDLSELYIVEDNTFDIMTESFGSCEYMSTDSEEAFISGMAEQAAAQGITYLVSAGDNGAEGCDSPNSPAATHPPSVNLLASTPFNVAVGGTEFNENGQDNLYWSSTNSSGYGSALSYIPEDVWNESCAASTCGSNANLSAGSGGASSGNIGSGGTFSGFSKPSWQSGVAGIPNDGFRDVPDVSLTSASHDPYVLCLEGSCIPNSQGQFHVYFVWGTSAAAPSFAGIMAMVDVQMANLSPGNGRVFRQGQANYVLYPLAASENLSLCNASATPLPASTCIFNDVTVGNNSVPGEAAYPNGLYAAKVGYDQATGLGSVNVANLVNNWSTVKFNATSTALTLNGGTTPISITHGQTITVSAKVTANSGTPTGAIVLEYAGPPRPSTLGAFQLDTGGQASGSTSSLPGSGIGYNNIWAHYSGDGTYAASDSNTIAVTVTPEPSTTTLSLQANSPSGQVVSSPFPFGSLVFVRADITGQSGHGIPTGTVTFTDTCGGANSCPLPSNNAQMNPPVAVSSSPSLNSQGNTSIGDGIISFDAGNHSIAAGYSGDQSFNSSSSSTPLTFTVAPGFAMVPWFPGPATVVVSSPGGSGTTNIGVIASSGFNTTITFTCSGLPAEAQCSAASATGQGPTTVVSTTITITTTAPHLIGAQSTDHRRYNAAAFVVGIPVTGIFLLVSSKRRRRYGLLSLMLAILSLIPACGGGSPSPVQQQQQDPGTPSGTYKVIVTGTASGAPSQQVFFYLIIK